MTADQHTYTVDEFSALFDVASRDIDPNAINELLDSVDQGNTAVEWTLPKERQQELLQQEIEQALWGRVHNDDIGGAWQDGILYCFTDEQENLFVAAYEHAAERLAGEIVDTVGDVAKKLLEGSKRE